jgi:hypothetical protein
MLIGLASEWVGKRGRFVHTIAASATQEEVGTQIITAATFWRPAKSVAVERGGLPLPPLQPIPRKRVEYGFARC